MADDREVRAVPLDIPDLPVAEPVVEGHAGRCPICGQFAHPTGGRPTQNGDNTWSWPVFCQRHGMVWVDG